MITKDMYMLQISRKFRLLTRIIMPSCIVLLLLLAGFQALPLSHYEVNYLNSAETQRVRSQILVKSALTLAYRPAAEHSQAISDMQVVLPLFIQEQQALNANRSADVQQAVQLARSDYSALVSSSQSIIAHADKPIDRLQVDILVAHNHGFVNAETEVIAVLLNHEAADQTYLFVLECILDGLLLLLGVFFLISFEVTTKGRSATSKEVK